MFDFWLKPCKNQAQSEILDLKRQPQQTRRGRKIKGKGGKRTALTDHKSLYGIKSLTTGGSTFSIFEYIAKS